MDVIKISTDKCPKPGGWYSQAFRTGDLIFTAGVTANDPVTQELVGPGDIVKQTEQILKNMDNLLREAGSDLDHVIKTLVFVSNIDDFEILKKNPALCIGSSGASDHTHFRSGTVRRICDDQ